MYIPLKRVDITDKTYHGMKDHLNASAIREFYNDRYKFYKKYILGETIVEKKSTETIIGDMVHALLAENGDYDSKFTMASVREPSGQMMELVQALYNRTLKSRDGDGAITEPFSNLFQDAVNYVKYDYDGTEIAFKGKTLEKIVELFTTADKKSGAVGELYYKELLANTGKTVITESQGIRAEKTYQRLKEHPYTSSIVNMRTEGVDVYKEEVILFEIQGIGKCRAKLDLIHVDHNSKTIQPYDYKCTWTAEDGLEYSYLKNMYYIPAAFYHVALVKWIENTELKDYKVLPMIYIAIDPAGDGDPILYPLTIQDLGYAYNGFTLQTGRRYKGVKELLHEIEWHIGSGIWSRSYESNINNGIVPLNVNYK